MPSDASGPETHAQDDEAPPIKVKSEDEGTGSKPLLSPDFKTCLACNVSCPTPEHMGAHFMTEAHVANTARYYGLQKPNPSCTISPSSSSYPATSKCSCNTYNTMLGSTTHGSLCLETPDQTSPAENFKIKRVMFYPVLLHCLKNYTSITWGKVPKTGSRIEGLHSLQ